MAIQSVTAVANATANQAQTTVNQSVSASGARVNSAQFMQLLTTQLKNQNPFDPVADTEFLAQLAQFSTLEETQAQRTDIQDLALTMKSNAGIQGLGQASTLIGKNITYIDDDAVEQTGMVSGVRVANGTINMEIGNQLVPLGRLASVAKT